MVFGWPKKIPVGPSAGQEVSPQLAERIHVMPERFYFVPRPRANATFVLLGTTTIVVGVLVVIALVVWKSGRPPEASPGDSAAVGSPSPTPPTVVSPSPTATPIPTVTPTPEATESPAPKPSVSPTPTPATSPVVVADAGDEDQDGLTLAEENLFQTNPTNPDSDSDGYQDGAEVRRGFSPNAGGGATLLASGVFVLYPAPAGFRWARPVNWNVAEVDESDGRFMVRFDTGAGEYVSATRYPNPERLTLAAWLTRQGLSAGQPTTVGGQPAVRGDVDGPYFLLTSDQQGVLGFSYEAQGNTPRFRATFAAIISSVQLTP